MRSINLLYSYDAKNNNHTQSQITVLRQEEKEELLFAAIGYKNNSINKYIIEERLIKQEKLTIEYKHIKYALANNNYAVLPALIEACKNPDLTINKKDDYDKTLLDIALDKATFTNNYQAFREFMGFTKAAMNSL